MEFGEVLQRLGFTPGEARQSGSRGVRTYISRPNAYLSYHVHAYDDGTALFTWEFAVTDYLLEWEIQLGSSESLNTFMYPVSDDRGPQEATWLASVIERVESRLHSIDFLDPQRPKS